MKLEMKLQKSWNLFASSSPKELMVGITNKWSLLVSLRKVLDKPSSGNLNNIPKAQIWISFFQYFFRKIHTKPSVDITILFYFDGF